MTKIGFEYIALLVTLVVISELICNTFFMKNVFGHVAFSNVIRFQTHIQKNLHSCSDWFESPFMYGRERRK
jgi:hypothetical protein